MEIDFRGIVSNALKEHCEELLAKLIDEPCPDQYVGEISKICYLKNEFHSNDSDRKEFCREDAVKCKRDPKRSNVILILESPHINEFKYQGYQGPAQGVTGTNIRIYLKEILENINVICPENGLILMNAIRYQCSLGMPTDCVRDEIFLRLWEAGGRGNFEKRLNNIFQNGDVLINCCTSGSGKRDLVTQSIGDVSRNLGIESLITGSHPSFWSIKRNRRPDKFKYHKLPY